MIYLPPPEWPEVVKEFFFTKEGILRSKFFRALPVHSLFFLMNQIADLASPDVFAVSSRSILFFKPKLGLILKLDAGSETPFIHSI